MAVGAAGRQEAGRSTRRRRSPSTSSASRQRQGQLAEALRPGRRMGELAEATGLPVDEITRLLYALSILGVVVPADSSAQGRDRGRVRAAARGGRSGTPAAGRSIARDPAPLPPARPAPPPLAAAGRRRSARPGRSSAGATRSCRPTSPTAGRTPSTSSALPEDGHAAGFEARSWPSPGASRPGRSTPPSCGHRREGPRPLPGRRPRLRRARRRRAAQHPALPAQDPARGAGEEARGRLRDQDRPARLRGAVQEGEGAHGCRQAPRGAAAPRVRRRLRPAERPLPAELAYCRFLLSRGRRRTGRSRSSGDAAPSTPAAASRPSTPARSTRQRRQPRRGRGLPAPGHQADEPRPPADRGAEGACRRTDKRCTPGCPVTLCHRLAPWVAHPRS